MKFSLFTPTHNPVYINRLRESIAAQTHKDYEWVIVPNGSCSVADLQHIISSEPKSRVVQYEGKTNNIGEIKKFAAGLCRGDILVEVDHDDELTPDCLAELAKAFEDPLTDFVYSNCCEIAANGDPHTYNECFGWKYRPFQWKGQDLLETISFPVEPSPFSKIWFAPNHVRAWRTSFYKLIGGHDASMEVCDDHDIMCRTYISGNIKHVDKVLYIYHFTGGNTSTGDKNSLIQDMTLGIHDKYIYQMAERWCDDNGLRKIDLCGGFNSPQGYESVDLFGGDITADLEKAWPIEDGTVGLIRAHDALEHLHDPIHVMKEAYRVLATKGWFLTLTPTTDGRGAFQDPTHCAFYNSNSFWYYTREEQAQYINTPVKFQLSRIKNFYPSDWHQFHQIMYVKADLYKFDPDGRNAGLIEI
jgi:SAM-dependent methyltransferase